jgi:hypothetical protein
MDQSPPRGDNRYRTHRSVKCYVAELIVGTGGATFYLNQSAERVIHLFPGGIEKVVYRTRFYPLLPNEMLAELAKSHQRRGCMVMVGGKALYPDDTNQSFVPFPLIEITPQSERLRFEAILRARE